MAVSFHSLAKGANRDAKVYVGSSVTVYNPFVLTPLHGLRNQNVSIGAKLSEVEVELVSSSVRSKQLLCLCTVRAKKLNK